MQNFFMLFFFCVSSLLFNDLMELKHRTDFCFCIFVRKKRKTNVYIKILTVWVNRWRVVGVADRPAFSSTLWNAQMETWWVALYWLLTSANGLITKKNGPTCEFGSTLPTNQMPPTGAAIMCIIWVNISCHE